MSNNFDRRRWGQNNNVWNNLNNTTNERLRRAYIKATEGLNPFAGTWAEVRTKTDCLGAFRAQPAAGWCQLNNGINQVMEPIDKFAVDCGGHVIGGMISGGVRYAKTIYLIPQGMALGAGGGAASCIAQKMWGDVWNLFDKQRLSPEQREHVRAMNTYAAARRAWAGML